MAVDKLVDSTQLDADLTSVANAIRTKGGTSAQLAFPAGFVDAIDAIQTGGGGVVEPLYSLGSYYKDTNYVLTRRKNHIKIEWTYGSPSGISIGLREFDKTNLPEWFSITAGSLVELRYENVVNTNGVIWNANLKQADTNTSLSYGIGNDTHENGAIVTATPTQDQSIGCLFVYLSGLRSGQALEFDVILTVDGVRYI